MTVHHLRPSPKETFGATRPKRDIQVADDQKFWLWMTALLAGIILPVLVLLVAAEGIARAFDRPEACRYLTAHECSAKLQEGSGR